MEDEQKQNVINFDDMPPPRKRPWKPLFLDPRREDGSRSIRKFDPEEAEQTKKESSPETE